MEPTDAESAWHSENEEDDKLAVSFCCAVLFNGAGLVLTENPPAYAGIIFVILGNEFKGLFCFMVSVHKAL